MKIAILGDIHFPGRADDLPDDFFEMIIEEDPDLIVYTGDLDSEETLRAIKSLGKKTLIVKGNVDYIDLPEKEIIEVENIRILVFHSSEIKPRGDPKKILKVAKEEGCDIVIFGHTHLPLLKFMDGVLLINPGSSTGVISGEGIIPPRSFVILDIIERNFIEVRFYMKTRWGEW